MWELLFQPFVDFGFMRRAYLVASQYPSVRHRWVFF